MGESVSVRGVGGREAVFEQCRERGGFSIRVGEKMRREKGRWIIWVVIG